MLNLTIFLLHFLASNHFPPALTSFSSGDTDVVKTKMAADEKQVLQAEKTRFKAMVDKDLDQLDKVIHGDLVYIHSNGNVDNKESFIAPLKDGSRSYDDITIDDPKVRIYGDVGIINATCTYHRTTAEGQADNLSLLYTSVYAKIDSRWQHVSWQSFKVVE